MNYYNEFNPEAAQWLKNLVAGGLIPAGDVDNRSITEVDPNELKKYTQCHFFAGIAGWSYALQLAGWPADRNVWTGSCPCQPFSSAGKHKGKKDERHLWPVWFNLIKECRPATIFGEQVARAIAHGWFDEVTNDLESYGYSWGGAIIPACSVGAPHKRERLWFVADSPRVLSQGRIDGQGQEQPWGNSELIQCPDGKQRLVKPGICLLADGVSSRVVKLSALGNAIVPQVAAEFIKSFMDIEGELQNV